MTQQTALQESALSIRSGKEIDWFKRQPLSVFLGQAVVVLHPEFDQILEGH